MKMTESEVASDACQAVTIPTSESTSPSESTPTSESISTSFLAHSPSPSISVPNQPGDPLLNSPAMSNGKNCLIIKGEGYDDDEWEVEEAKREGRGIHRFVRKYFLQGHMEERQIENGMDEDDDGGANSRHIEQFLESHRRCIAFLLPCLFMQLVWWLLAIRFNFFRLFPSHYKLPLTMVLGATIAGMTSEGGGAIAFPVMTLILKINPLVARDFSLMIQSCGMTSAAFTILWMRIKLEWHSIVLCTIGSSAGIVFGLEFVDTLFTGPEKKMLFVSIWLSFAISLFILNTQNKRQTFGSIVQFNWWKALVLYITGFVGGLCSAFAGSGVDICSFSVLTLLFRVSEKVATPTSVILMAANTCVGFFWRHLMMGAVSQLAWDYFTCSVPIVVVCAPLGSLLASQFHRLVLAALIYILEVLAVIGFLATGPQIHLILIGCSIIFASLLFFLSISWLGQQIHGLGDKINEKRKCKFECRMNGQQMLNGLHN